LSEGCSSRERVVSIAVPVPSLDLLTYLVPEAMPTPVVGARVLVPLGTRLVTGIVISVGATSTSFRSRMPKEHGPIKPIKELIDREAFVPADVVGLAQWTAEYYAAGVGDAIPLLLPPMARGARADAHKNRRLVSITPAGLDAMSHATTRQRDALQLLAGSPEGVATAQLAVLGVPADLVARLVRRGYASIRQERVDRNPFGGRSGDAPNPKSEIEATRTLTGEQESACRRLRAFLADGRFTVALLHGVTGSGKTEIYLRLAGITRAGGRRSLVLVPEIALTPAIAERFRAAFGDRVAIQHSGLSDGERHDQWQRIRRGDVDVVVGTRSAVFAPLERIGLVVVDEEHDASYKQEESPRYNGRDVAIVRAQRADALAILGSATPSMESYHNAMTGKYARVVLERRVLDRPLAAVTVVDMREEFAAEGPDVILSRRLREAIAERLSRREQTLVLLNRRGLATAVFCRQCAGTIDCPNCSVSLVVHGDGQSQRARCHYCNYTARVPTKCPLCAGPYLQQTGFGTERVEADIRHAFPAARLARLDRDAIRRRGALSNLLSRFQAGEIDVLVGTQMIAKGHDFPRVTLVGVVSADVGLGVADFRASERTFQILTQVVGRAGRGERPGEAIVQTLYPHHYSVELACRQDFQGFYAKESQFRRSMRYPPHVSLVNVVVRARTFGLAMDDASDLAERVRKNAVDAGVRVLGPAPPPLGKLRGEYRAQILLKGTRRARVREALKNALEARPDLARRVIVDVDPLSVT
jgi:primosomal protein N' (replication factor Y)